MLCTVPVDYNVRCNAGVWKGQVSFLFYRASIPALVSIQAVPRRGATTCHVGLVCWNTSLSRMGFYCSRTSPPLPRTPKSGGRC
jgi:hypothetical protein